MKNRKLRLTLWCVFYVVVLAGVFGLDSRIDLNKTRNFSVARAQDIANQSAELFYDSVSQAQRILDGVSSIASGKKRFTSADMEQMERVCRISDSCSGIVIVGSHGPVAATSSEFMRVDFGRWHHLFNEGGRKGSAFVGPSMKTDVGGHFYPVILPVTSGGSKTDFLAVAMMSDAQYLLATKRISSVFSPAVSVYTGTSEVITSLGSRMPTPDIHHIAVRGQGVESGKLEIYDSKDEIFSGAYKKVPLYDVMVEVVIPASPLLAMWDDRFWSSVKIWLVAVFFMVGILYVYWGEYKEMNKDIVTDKLTLIGNRAKFDAELEARWNRSRKGDGEMSVILVDVDCFKLYNDNYGHQAGDDRLQQVAAALASCARRPTDVVCRYGGEEFVVLAEGERDAEWLAEQMRASVESLKIPHAYSKAAPYVTISVGLASSANPKIDRSASLVKAADEALYEAKEQGRNRVYKKTLEKRPLQLVA